ncbi:MAG: sll1863 family stress response protein [Syntrophorhabdaceae bacterium]
MPERKKPPIEPDTDSKDISVDQLGKDNNEDHSGIDEFIVKIEASNRNNVDAPGMTGGRTKTNHAETAQAHDALLDDLESSMDRSMRELDERYKEKFSELDDKIEENRPSETISGDRTQKMETRLMECGAAVAMLKARLDESENDVKQHCEQEIESLQEELAAARQKLRALQQSDNSEGLGHLKESLYNVMSGVSHALKNLVLRLKEAKETR